VGRRRRCLYADSVRDPLIQQFTTDSPTLTAADVRAAFARLRASGAEDGFVITDAVTGDRLGNIALQHDGTSGEVSYWVAADARGRGVARRALILFSEWSFRSSGRSGRCWGTGLTALFPGRRDHDRLCWMDPPTQKR
jgi:[ribosomal protein S5]-alanine N-acetyltransferase